MNALGKPLGFVAYSAGSTPKGQVHPLALKTLESHGISTAGFRSKSWDEFARPDAPHLDFVFTVCDKAAGEVCPVWPGQPVTAHWGMPDPASEDLLEAARDRAFLDSIVTLRRRIELMLSLPFEKLDAVALKTQINAIGKQ
uniref:arsenate reductase ArsC n=1 Tax=Niveibacterium sp. SC-1 TaxID=3135646 RepID=UPI0040542A3F